MYRERGYMDLDIESLLQSEEESFVINKEFHKRGHSSYSFRSFGKLLFNSNDFKLLFRRILHNNNVLLF